MAKKKQFTVIRTLTGTQQEVVAAESAEDAEDAVDWTKVKEDLEVTIVEVYEGEPENPCLVDPVLVRDYS